MYKQIMDNNSITLDEENDTLIEMMPGVDAFIKN